MPPFSAARTNMVDCQIHTAGVINPNILAAFNETPRERFTPASFKAVSYGDEEIPMGGKRFLMAPATHARMLQAVEPTGQEEVLDVGGASGYSAAIMARLARTVTAVDQDAALLEKARIVWGELGLRNIEAVIGAHAAGNQGRAPFDLIFINGAVAEIPARLAAQLSNKGRMILILKKPDASMGQAMIITRTGETGFSSRPLFEAASSYLPGFEPKPVFQF